MDEYEAHIREGRCPVTGSGPGRDARGDADDDDRGDAATFDAAGPFEIQGAPS
jgi:hypothetical protein